MDRPWRNIREVVRPYIEWYGDLIKKKYQKDMLIKGIYNL